MIAYQLNTNYRYHYFQGILEKDGKQFQGTNFIMDSYDFINRDFDKIYKHAIDKVDKEAKDHDCKVMGLIYYGSRPVDEQVNLVDLARLS